MFPEDHEEGRIANGDQIDLKGRRSNAGDWRVNQGLVEGMHSKYTYIGAGFLVLPSWPW